MPKISFVYVFVFLSILLSCKISQVAQPKETFEVIDTPAKTVFTIGDASITNKDLEGLFTANTIEDSTDFNTFLEEIIFQQRLYTAAKDKGILEDSELLEEIDSYLSIIAPSFVMDSSEVNKLAKLTYERLKTEINASHILIPLAIHASAGDSLKAYHEAIVLKKSIEIGAPFDSLATIYSGDINTKGSGGKMGWFSALQLLYPLENAAYETHVGSVSMPARTKAGYHILLINDKRAYSGKVKVRHILKAVPLGSSDEFESFQKNKIDSLKSLIEKGIVFEELCQVNSDDKNTSLNGGELAPFSIGSRQERNFESVAFGLKQNEVSAPVRTEIGWHLIQQIDKLPLESFEELEEHIYKKITTDSRGAYLKNTSLKPYVSKLNIKVNSEALDEIVSLADSRIKERTWSVKKNMIDQRALLKIADKSFSNLDFIDYALDKQTFEKQFENFSPDTYLRGYFEDFRSEKIDAAVLENLPLWNSKFATMAMAYKQSIASSRYLSETIYEKTLEDTLGQRDFYLANIEKYKLPKQAQAIIVKANKLELLDKFAELTEGKLPYRLKRGIRPMFFDKLNSDLDDEKKHKLIGLTVIMQNNPDYIVEVGGHRDINEDLETSAERLNKIVRFLLGNGLDITRIREYDYGTSRLADRFDWTQNQRVSFQFFTREKKDLLKTLNSDKDHISIEEKSFYQGENNLIDGTEWEPGVYEANYDNNYFIIELNKVLPARPKTFKEAYPAVLADFQKHLEEQLRKELAVKYPAEVNTEEIKKLYTEFKKKNL
ncbi:MAG: peptidyl-prolyl cis-trans isomerase SurA [Arcticibacterium sp.]|jgi:peptidyl-prolyl cis-trans isomerase SurA